MAIRRIVLMGDEILRESTEEVEIFDDALEALVEDMFETMYHAEGIGLAAPQIGISKRLCVVHVRQPDEGTESEPMALVNPRVVWSSDETERGPEGCLSIPGLEEVVERSARVVVEALDPEGEPLTVEASGLEARALQHEIDHLDGILFIDRVSPLKRRMLLKKWKKVQPEVVS